MHAIDDWGEVAFSGVALGCVKRFGQEVQDRDFAFELFTGGGWPGRFHAACVRWPRRCRRYRELRCAHAGRPISIRRSTRVVSRCSIAALRREIRASSSVLASACCSASSAETVCFCSVTACSTAFARLRELLIGVHLRRRSGAVHPAFRPTRFDYPPCSAACALPPCGLRRFVPARPQPRGRPVPRPLPSAVLTVRIPGQPPACSFCGI